MCNDGDGWYPASFYNNKSLECDFRFKESYVSISYFKKDIFNAIGKNKLQYILYVIVINHFIYF